MSSVPQERQSGQVMMIIMVIILMVMALLAATMTQVTSSAGENRASRQRLERFYIAEAGLQAAVRDLNEGGDGTLGTAETPVPFDVGGYNVVTRDNADGTYVCKSWGWVDGSSSVVEGLIAETAKVFDHAVFAGNSSNDPGYVLKFEGNAGSSDVVNGDVYSGQDIAVDGGALVNGALRASGSISGAPGAGGISQPIPDVAGMHYDENHDIDVAAEFDQLGTWTWDNAGGSAWQVPSSSPAHVFRKNPSDRKAEYLSTEKDDYFLEDPYEPIGVDSDQDGSDAYPISFTGDHTPGFNHSGFNRKVFFIDGNLWLHNYQTYSFRLDTKCSGNQITFAVRGNVYISDNLFYDKNLDGLAFVAIADPDVADSGNVYFGDPRFGTLMSMDAFLYAENDFHDVNLSADGSKTVTLNGTMSAGDHVDIQRTFGQAHSKLTVNFDPRLRDGDIDIPGLPSAGRTLDFALVMWRRGSDMSDVTETAGEVLDGGFGAGGGAAGGTGTPGIPGAKAAYGNAEAVMEQLEAQIRTSSNPELMTAAAGTAQRIMGILADSSPDFAAAVLLASSLSFQLSMLSTDIPPGISTNIAAKVQALVDWLTAQV